MKKRAKARKKNEAVFHLTRDQMHDEMLALQAGKVARDACREIVKLMDAHVVGRNRDVLTSLDQWELQAIFRLAKKGAGE